MATEVVQNRWCDHHLVAKDERVPGEEWTLSLTPPGERVATFVLDACGECAQPFRDLLAHLIEEGRPMKGTRRPVARSAPEATSASGTEYACPSCGHVVQTRQAIMRHVRSVHGVTLAELEGMPAPHACADCDRTFTTPQGLGVHRKRIHPETFVPVSA